METISEAPRFIKKLVDLGFDVRKNAHQNENDLGVLISKVMMSSSQRPTIIALTDTGAQGFPATIYGAKKGESAVICAIADQVSALDTYNLLFINPTADLVEEAEREFFKNNKFSWNDFNK